MAGPDGALWFTDLDDNEIGRITTAGRIRLFRLPRGRGRGRHRSRARRRAVAGGFPTPAGSGGSRPPAGTASFRTPTPDDGPEAIVAGPDGALWFTRTFGIGRITTSGEITELSVPEREDDISVQAGIAAGPDGAIWFTQQTDPADPSLRGRKSGQIGRIDLPGSASQILVAKLARGPYRGRRGRRVRVRYTSTRAARGTLELRRGRRRFARRRVRARPGENTARLRLPRRPGRYRLRLRVRVRGQAATDTAVLTITR